MTYILNRSNRQNRNTRYRLIVFALLLLALLGALFAAFITIDAKAADGCHCDVIPGAEPLPPPIVVAAFADGTNVRPTHAYTLPTEGPRISSNDVGSLLVFPIIDVNLNNQVDPSDVAANDPISNVVVLVGFGDVISETQIVTSTSVYTSSSIGQITLPPHKGYYFFKVYDNYSVGTWDAFFPSPKTGFVKIEYVAYQKPYVMLPQVSNFAISSGEFPD